MDEAQARVVDLACFGYLAATRVLVIDRYPNRNEGAEITGAAASVAGDAPLVAAFASGLGLRAALESNHLGSGEGVRELGAFLDRNRVIHELDSGRGPTPEAIILADTEGNREWFVSYGRAREELLAATGTYLTSARLAYIDCFDSIAEASARAIGLASNARVPIYANVGGSPPGRWDDVLAGRHVAVVQASLDETRHDEALAHARRFSALGAETVIVTCGVHGAVAQRDEHELFAPARAVDVDWTHGAGAAFAAGFISCHLRGQPIDAALAYGCALGSMQCSRARSEAPAPADVERFIAATRPALP
jgi:sugar/nucleoside kinase (ribokinase family)